VEERIVQCHVSGYLFVENIDKLIFATSWLP
jgi:hypothetical protein